MTDSKDHPPQILGLPADPHSLVSFMKQYLQWMEERNYSVRTLKGRRHYLTHFIAWCDSRALFYPTLITKPILERYQRHLFLLRKQNGQPLSFKTQRFHINAVQVFFKWLVRQNHLLYNPASELDLPRAEVRLPQRVLTVKEAERIMGLPDIKTVYGLRDRAMLETLYSTGMRRLELSNLKVSDLDRERGTVMIRQGKGKKDRLIPIGERALLWTEKYLYESRPQLIAGRDEGVLFLSRFGGAISLDQLTGLVSDYIKQIGQKGACHLFRHTAATLMLDNGADIRFIQAMLGHASLDTTQKYTHLSIKQLKEVHSRTHPAQLKRSGKQKEDRGDEALQVLMEELEEEGEDED